MALTKLEEKIFWVSPTTYIGLLRGGNIMYFRHRFECWITTGDKLCWFDFFTKYNRHQFPNEDEMINEVRLALPGVLGWDEAEQVYVKKIDCGRGLMTKCKPDDKFDGMSFSCVGKTTVDYTVVSRIIELTIPQFLQRYFEFVPVRKQKYK